MVLIVCPNVTIRDRLQELNPERGEASLYRTRDLVPAHLMPNLTQGETNARAGFTFAAGLQDLIIARLTPKGYEEISRAHLLEPTNTAAGRDVLWSHPAFANRRMYARNDKEIICVSMAAQ